MGRKVHPIGFRLGINKPWLGRWYAEGKDYTEQLHQDLEIRKLMLKEAERAGVSGVEIEHYPGKVKVSLHTAKPGILIGRKGESVKVLRQELEALTGKKIDLEVKEIKSADTDAYLVAQNIAGQLERRISYRRAMKRAIQQALRQGAGGIKISVSGRLSGAEMARRVTLREGRVPL
ncbi:MAG TPA: 30S ribosomal protein S3 [Anaerolineaceae bacterium]|nr:30S ribosomal protein S3 [Anaerolineaceae bacterium]